MNLSCGFDTVCTVAAYLLVQLRFISRHGNSDLLNVSESTVPPIDLTKISIFAGPLLKHKQKAIQLVAGKNMSHVP